MIQPPGGTTEAVSWLYGLLAALFAAGIGALLTNIHRRIGRLENGNGKHGERLSTLEAHREATEGRLGRIEEKLDAILQACTRFGPPGVAERFPPPPPT